MTDKRRQAGSGADGADDGREPQPRGRNENAPKRPRLKVKGGRGRNGDAGAAQPSDAAAPNDADSNRTDEAKERAEAGQAAEPSDGPKTVKRVSLPTPQELASRYAFATYRSAPSEEGDGQGHSGGTGAPASERELSTGFVLGVALVVVVLVGGIWLARMGRRVGRLEKRVEALESLPSLLEGTGE